MIKSIKSLKLPKYLAKILQTRRMSATAERLIETERHGRVCMIALNRPQKRNCVNQATALQLWEAIEEFENDKELYVAVLYGKGGNFCAGYDLEELSQMSDTAMSTSEDLQNGRGPMGPSRRFIKKPIIAAVEGYAVAGGLELSLMCDMRIAEETTIMGVFCRRFGVPLLDGGTARLPQLIGLSRAMGLILTGTGVTGKEAFEMGLVNRVVPTGAALGTAFNTAQSLCKYPQECMNRDRLSAYYSCYNAKNFDEAVEFEWQNAKHVVQAESIKGATSFTKGVGKSGSFESFKAKSSKL